MSLSRPVIALLVFIAAAMAVTSRGPFVNEDYEKIGANTAFFSSGTMASKMFEEEAGFERMYYRPLNNLVMAGLGRLWGNQSAGRFRAVAAFAFGLAILAFYAAARRLGLPEDWAFGMTALFALHPFNSWSYFQASWIGNALVIPAMALVFWVWDRAVRTERFRAAWALALALLMYAACLARDSAGLIVFMLVPLAAWVPKPKRAWAIALWGAAFAGAFLYYVQRSFVISDPTGVYDAVRFRNSLANTGGAVLQYLGTLAWGTPRNYGRPIAAWGGWPLTLAVAALIAALLWSVRRRRTLFFLAWCATIGLLEIAFSLWVSQEMAPSRTTLACVFLLLIGGLLCSAAKNRWPGIAVLALIVWYGAQSVSHVYASLDEDRFYHFHNDKPYNSKTLFVWGRLNHERKKWDEAIRAYAESLKFANRAVTHGNLALALWGRGQGSDLDEGIGHMKEALKREPDNAGFHANLGMMLAKSGDTENAVLHYFRALELDPAQAPAYAGLEEAYVRSRAPGQEAFVPEDHFAGLKKSAVFYNNLSLVYARAGKLAEAEECLRRALELNPRSVKALNNLGMARVQERKLAEAAGLFAQALAVDPGYERARLNLGLALAKQGKMSEAVPHFQEALRRNPKSAEAARYLKQAEADLAR